MVFGEEGLLLARMTVVVDVDWIDEGDFGAKVGEVVMATAGVSIAVCVYVCVSLCP